MRQNFELANALSAAEQTDLVILLNKAADLLRKYAVNLSPEERKSARSVAARRESYVRHSLRAARQHEQLLPRDFNVSDYNSLMEQYDQHKNISVIVNELTELVNDTSVAIGQELMAYTDTLYNSLKIARTRNASVEHTLAELEAYNSRSSNEDGGGYKKAE